MLCYAMLYYAMLFYSTLWNAMVCYGILCYAMLWNPMLCYAARFSVNAQFVDNLACLTTLQIDRKSTRLNSSHLTASRMPSSA